MSIDRITTSFKRPRETSEEKSHMYNALAIRNEPYASSQSHSSSSIICYGALNDAAAQYLDSAITPDDAELTNCKNFYRFSVRPKEEDYVLVNNGNEAFCILDTRSIGRLTTLKGLQSVHFQALAAANDFTKRRKKIKGHQTFIVSINIFGPQDVAPEAASRLSKVSAFLQHPESLEPGFIYSNPQYFRLLGADENMNDYIGMGCTKKMEYASSYNGKKKRNTMSSTSYGGIIADVVGLGKTLTMLTAILHSLPSAEKHGMFYQREHNMSLDETPTGATLVVVTSAQLIESWKTEIGRHFTPGTLSYLVFHGPKRTSNKEDLTSSSIILTTYATVVADRDSLDVLGQMNWYRIVLDEAHWIRNPTSKQFRAVSSLITNRRWCMTGTPIQNKLEELASLASFLRLPPFPSKSTFQSNILTPLSQGGPNYARPLRAYLQAYCLRRTESHLDLLKSSDESIYLSLSTEERILYKRILEQSRREIDEIVSGTSNIKKYNVLFTTILKMRMLCDKGTLPASGASTYLSPQKPSAKCERCSEINEDDALLLESFSFCPDCDRPLHLSSPYAESGLSPRPDYSIGSETMSQEAPSTNPHSTKLSAVVNQVYCYGTEAKHIVFSYWTSTLDALVQLCNMAEISHVHIDGRTSYTERSKRLDTFRHDPKVTVLLMSIETGAVGLNLTAANVVHIVEPQWNPSVEDQAVARALRMGQTKEVKIFRYIMKNTVEENIIGLQKKKKRLATFTFDGDNEGVQEKLEDLNFVLGTNPGPE
ncbi:hypothetical protein NW762_004309 [Fusarium torreyae]|uniref:Uncharacterized protein n=1 Tax=Fusarium torreyae TaxID=1237075 RepID=A0A9W8S8Q4_9HYPO|nr:hypothetical protein NW762_004309 [Fusarium torreyae]